MSNQKSVFSRWNKTAILDLIEKLKVNDIPYSLKKTELIDLLEGYLNNLEIPLEDVIEYPELVEFYSNKKAKLDEPTIATPVQDDLVSFETSTDENKSKISNFIDFTRLLPKKLDHTDDDQEASRLGVSQTDVNKHGEDEEYEEDKDEDYIGESGEEDLEDDKDAELDNIDDDPDDLLDMGDDTPLQRLVGKVQQLNEDVQDYLSTIYSIVFICNIMELTVFCTHLLSVSFTCNDDVIANHSPDLLSVVTNITIWLIVSIILPSLVGYYINFIRYDIPSMEVDPMIFSIVKTSIAYILVTHPQFLQFSRTNCFNNRLQTFIKIFNNSLGQLPLFIGIIYCVLTLYIF